MNDERGTLTWGQTVEALRRLRRWTQGRLAEAAGISVSTHSAYEQGKEPSDEVRSQVEDALGAGGWLAEGRQQLEGLLLRLEGGPVAPELDRLFKDTAAQAGGSAETALRAGLEALRRKRR